MAKLVKLGIEIKSIRGALTQQEFARILEINQGSVAKYENGLAMPRASILFQIAELGHISMETLLKRANLARSFSQSAQPQTSSKDSANELIRNPVDFIVTLRKIYDLDHKLGELVTNLVKAFSKAAKNPNLTKKRRKAAENALKAISSLS